MPVADALVALGRKRQRGAHASADAVDAGAREPLGDQPVAPVAYFGRAQEHDRLARQRRGHMQLRARGVVRIAATCGEIGFVGVERFGNSDRATVVGGLIAGLAPGELARLVESLPVGQHRTAVTRLEVVGEPDALDPVNARSGDAHVPGAGAFVTPVSEKNIRSYLGVDWTLGDRQLAPLGGGFEPLGSRFLRRHWGVSPLVSQTGA